MDYYKQMGPAMAALGWEPLPLNGKAPVVKSWASMEISRQVTQQWASKYAAHNVGMRLGQYSEGRGHLMCLDCDCEEERLSGAVYRHVRAIAGGKPLPLRRRGNSRFAVLIWLADTNGDKESSDRYWNPQARHEEQLELLGKGQQVAVFGRHPEGQEYQWTADGKACGPDTFGPEDERVPVITDTDWCGICDFFSAKAKELGFKRNSGGRTTSQNAPVAATVPLDGDEQVLALAQLKTPGASVSELRELLFARLLPERCDQYESWTQVGMALHFETSGSAEGLRLYQSWSRLSEKWRGDEDVAAKWASFHLALTGDREVLAIGSLEQWAQEDEAKRMLADEGNNLKPLEVRRSIEEEDVATRSPHEASLKSRLKSLEEAVGTKWGGVIGAVRDFLEDADGDFTSLQLYQELNAKSAAEKKVLRQAMRRLCQAGEVEKMAGKTATYRKVVTDTLEMDFSEAGQKGLPLPLPCNLSSKIKILPKSVVVASGTTNSGKTGFVFETIALFLAVLYPEKASSLKPPNSHKTPKSLRSFKGSALALENFSDPEALAAKFMDTQLYDVEWLEDLRHGQRKPIRYMNSEMSADEILDRLSSFPQEMKELFMNKVEWIWRKQDWGRAVAPDCLNIVDYMEVYEDFYKIGSYISDVHTHLNRGVALICIQKKMDAVNPRGGEFALERARLALTLDANPSNKGGILKLVKVKNPLNFRDNPQEKELDYQFGPWGNLEPCTPLRYVNKKERARINAKYEEERAQRDTVADFVGLEGMEATEEYNGKELPF